MTTGEAKCMTGCGRLALWCGPCTESAAENLKAMARLLGEICGAEMVPGGLEERIREALRKAGAAWAIPCELDASGGGHRPQQAGEGCAECDRLNEEPDEATVTEERGRPTATATETDAWLTEHAEAIYEIFNMTCSREGYVREVAHYLRSIRNECRGGPAATAVLDEVAAELARARAKFPGAQNSAHEGYAVLAEEVDELWDEVKANHPERKARMRTEAIQVAAMAIRFIEDVCDAT